MQIHTHTHTHTHTRRKAFSCENLNLILIWYPNLFAPLPSMFSRLIKSFPLINGLHLRNLSTKFGANASDFGPRVPDNSKCINKVILMGRCVNDSPLRPINNTHYYTFIMVTNDLRKTKSNELVKRSDFHKVYVYQPFLAKKAHDLITKGTRVYIEGQLNYRKVDNQFFSNIVAEKMIFISGTNQNYDGDANDEIADFEEVDENFLSENHTQQKVDSQ